MSLLRVFNFAGIISSIIFLTGSPPLLRFQQTSSTQPDHVAVVLVADNSGSMSTNDPTGLRFTGARLFLSLLDNGDEAGVVEFSTDSFALTPRIVSLASPEEKLNLLQQVQPSRADGYTDVKAALKDAEALLDQAAGNDTAKYIVLLTDGQPEISHPYPSYKKETLDLAKSFNVPILAIALTSGAETSFLTQLTSETNGKVVPAKSSGDILSAYLEILGQIKDRTVLPADISVSGQTGFYLDPALQPYVQQASFVLSKPESVQAALTDPTGRQVAPNYPNLVFDQTADPRFAVLTIQNPISGNWQFKTQGVGKVGAYLVLHSRLRVRVDAPERFSALGRPVNIVVQLMEEQSDGSLTTIIGDANFSAEVIRPDGARESLDRFYDDGTHGDQQAGDGKWTRLYANTGTTGEYTILVHGTKGAIPVQASQRVDIIPFPSLIARAPSGTVEIKGQPLELNADLQVEEKTMLEAGKVQATITSPSRMVSKILLASSGDNQYGGTFMPDEDGAYQVHYETLDFSYQGMPFIAQADITYQVKLVRAANIQLNTLSPALGCLDQSVQLPLTITLTSAHKEWINISAAADSSFNLDPFSMELDPGTNKVNLMLSVHANHFWQEDSYQGNLLFQGTNGLEIQPSASLPILLTAAPFWSRCRTPLRNVGIIGFIFLAIAVLFTEKLREANKPSLVTGTLRYWKTEEGTSHFWECDLTNFHKPMLTIGRGKECEVLIEGIPNLQERHAVLRAEHTSQSIEIKLEPIGEVRKGYARVQTPFQLHHGDLFKMGGGEFQYLSDAGE